MEKTQTFKKHIIDLGKDWQRLIREASFLTIGPEGEVWPTGGEAPHYASVDVEDAAEWTICAHFPLKPSWIAIFFDINDRDAALDALLYYRRSRPIFYRDASNTFELTGDTVQQLVDEIDSHESGSRREDA